MTITRIRTLQSRSTFRYAGILRPSGARLRLQLHLLAGGAGEQRQTLDGEIAFPVEEITIAGNFLEMLRDVDAVGSDLLWLSRVAAPTLRVARMTVAGT